MELVGRGWIAGASPDQAPAVAFPRKRGRDVNRPRDHPADSGFADGGPGAACAAAGAVAESACFRSGQDAKARPIAGDNRTICSIHCRANSPHPRDRRASSRRP